jgi:hydrocephalus-inducing protein
MYQYDLKLTSLPAGMERPLYFKVSLGSQQIQTFRFLSFSKQKTEYNCKIENPDFIVERTISSSAGRLLINVATNGPIEMSVDVIYEPSRLGDTRAQLVVGSTTGGDFVCPLIGHCLSPKPQGPITIKTGVMASISFKNVYTSAAVFNCIVDNPAFIVKASETIPSKKTIALSIGYKQLQEKSPSDKASNDKNLKATSTKTGKLTIINPNTNISWVYYLRYSNS